MEYQQVGAGRMTWSQWSAMVGCAPFRQHPDQHEFSCHRRLAKEMCGRRVRYRVVAHNSRRLGGVKVNDSLFCKDIWLLYQCSLYHILTMNDSYFRYCLHLIRRQWSGVTALVTWSMYRQVSSHLAETINC